MEEQEREAANQPRAPLGRGRQQDFMSCAQTKGEEETSQIIGTEMLLTFLAPVPRMKLIKTPGADLYLITGLVPG